MKDAKTIFFIAVIVAATGAVSPPMALMGGIVFGLCFTHRYRDESKDLAKLLLQASVVALGFGMELHEVLQAGRRGLVYTALGVAAALLIGTALGRVLRVGKTLAFLISAGTAICGGSAIAAVAPIAEATDEEMSVSLGTVFILNSIALLVFPFIGWKLRLSQQQFGLWSAIAIHDTSSVRRRRIAIRGGGPGNRDHRQTGASALDRAAVSRYRGGQKEWLPRPVAVVHPSLLRSCFAEYLRPETLRSHAVIEPLRPSRAYRYPLPDR